MSTSLQFGVYKDGILWNAQGVGKFKSSPADGVTDCYTLIKDSAARHSSHPAVSERPVLERRTVEGMEKLRLGPYRSTTFSEYIKRVDAFGSGLQRLANLSPKDTVVIYADTQQSWMQCAFGCWRQGLCVGTIYSTLGDEGALFGLNQSEAKVVIADGKLLKVLGHIASKLISVKYVITLSDDGHASEGAEKCRAAGLTVAHLADLEASGVRGGLEPESLASSSDTAVLMYTSGTTGNPKGVMITHGNVCAMVAGTLSPTGPIGESYLGPGKSHLAYLPLAHIMELTVEISTLFCGGHVGYGSPGTVLATSPKMLQTSPPQEGDAEAFKPTLFLAAPVVLDKVVAGVRAKFRALPWLLRCFVDMGLENGAANWERGGCGATNPLYSIFFRKKVAKALGGQVKFIGTGSAPLSAEVQKFVATIFACPVRQGYGLTETTAITCITHHTDNSTRCVGPPTECACIRLRDWEEGGYLLSDANNPDIGMPRGEILVSGPTVCAGYYESHAIPDADVAQKNITDFVEIDGMRFFCTGDVGQILLNGNLAIIDRKKDLVKLQQGEYVALSKVENALKDSKYVNILPWLLRSLGVVPRAKLKCLLTSH